MSENGFTGWAIVELFGHNRIAGEISEQEIAGSSFLRVDVPAVRDQPAFTKFYHPSAVYAITPTSEQTALAAVAHFLARPIERWLLPDPKPLPMDDDVPDPDDDDDDPNFDDCPQCGRQLDIDGLCPYCELE
jgi:hypothetical protein